MNVLRLSTLSLTLAIAVITLGLAAVPALADPPDADTGCHVRHNKDCNGGDDGGRDETFYDVVITGTISGESTTPWLTFGKETSIGLNDSSLPLRPGVGKFTDLVNFFMSVSDDPLALFSAADAGICFAIIDEGNNLSKNPPFAIHQGRVQEGRGGRAQASFWFHASTHTAVDGELVTVLYALLLTGDFDEGSSLPPTGNSVVLSITAWQLTATNEGKAVKSASCIGEGTVTVNDVDVTVTGPVG